jgi:hypothetical protein
MTNQTIQKVYSTKNKINGGKVTIKWRGDNLEEVENELRKALQSVLESKVHTKWIPVEEYIERDKRDAKYKVDNKKTKSIFSLKIS